MIIVTGAAGFIGSNLVQALEARKTGETIAKIEDQRFLDWRNCWPFLDNRPSTITAVYHLGALTDTTCRDVRALDQQNTMFTMKLWRWCAKHQVPIIYASSAATYGDGSKGFSEKTPLDQLAPLNLYGMSKHLVDVSIEDAREFLGETPPPPHWYGLKFFNVYGPNEQHKGAMQSFVTKAVDAVMRQEKIRLFGNARSSTRDFVYVDDVVDVMLWLMERKPASGIYNVGTGKAISFLRVTMDVTAIHNELQQLMHPGCAPVSLMDTVELIDMPDHLRGSYQHHTQADIMKLRVAGYDKRFRRVSEGIHSYIRSLTYSIAPHQ